MKVEYWYVNQTRYGNRGIIPLDVLKDTPKQLKVSQSSETGYKNTIRKDDNCLFTDPEEAREYLTAIIEGMIETRQMQID